jgi:UDP:flavonoid glycosyltransferase YjiC (YdhE family)
MPRFLFCSLSNPGFLSSAIGIARKLQEKGHEVVFLTDKSNSELLARQKLLRIPRGPNDGPSFQVGMWGLPLAVAIQVKHIEYALEQFAADVIVGQQMTLGPLIVSERRKIPVGLIGLATYLWPSRRRAMPAIADAVEEHREWTLRETMDRYNQARDLFNLPRFSVDDGESPFLGDLLMLRSIPELEDDISHLPEQVHLVGSCIYEQHETHPQLEAWLQEAVGAEEPVIYVQHGRLFGDAFWPRLVEALAALKVRVVAEIGRLDCPVGSLPPNFFAAPFLPQTAVLRYAAVTIVTPTTSPVLGSLTAGVPSLLIHGNGGEQPSLAQRCKQAGVARVLPAAEASAGRIAAELTALLHDGAVAKAVLQMAKAFARMDKQDYATELLEQLVRTRSMVRRSPLRSCAVS